MLIFGMAGAKNSRKDHTWLRNELAEVLNKKGTSSTLYLTARSSA